MTYAEATAWLFQQLPMFQRQGAAAYKANLSGTLRVLDVLGRPDLRLHHIIHVAGTNGKGSVCTAIANALQTQGKRVGLFTSPTSRTSGSACASTAPYLKVSGW